MVKKSKTGRGVGQDILSLAPTLITLAEKLLPMMGGGRSHSRGRSRSRSVTSHSAGRSRSRSHTRGKSAGRRMSVHKRGGNLSVGGRSRSRSHSKLRAKSAGRVHHKRRATSAQLRNLAAGRAKLKHLRSMGKR